MEGKEFKTLIPVERARKAIRTGPIVEHPYSDDGVCGVCKNRIVCKKAKENLPLIFLEIAIPEYVHRCAKGTEVIVCKVLHGESYEGKDVDPLGTGGKRPVQAKKRKKAMKRAIPDGIYLVDANVFINAMNEENGVGKDSRWLIFNSMVRIATTKMVLQEVHDMDEKMKKRIEKTYTIMKIDVDICALRTYYREKEPSVRDLTLIQAAVDNRDVRGIITYDKDFANIAAGGMVRKLSGRNIDVLDPAGLKKKILKPEDRRL